MPPGQSALLYSMGFVIATGCLHTLGIGIGTVHRWTWGQKFLRIAGSLVVAGGVFFMWRAVARRPAITDAFRLRFHRIRTAHVGHSRRSSSEHHRHGPIYDGLMHFLMSPEVVPVLALALLAGLRAMKGCGFAAVAGGLAGLSGSWIASSGLLMLGWAVRTRSRIHLTTPSEMRYCPKGFALDERSRP